MTSEMLSPNMLIDWWCVSRSCLALSVDGFLIRYVAVQVGDVDAKQDGTGWEDMIRVLVG